MLKLSVEKCQNPGKNIFQRYLIWYKSGRKVKDVLERGMCSEEEAASPSCSSSWPCHIRVKPKIALSMFKGRGCALTYSLEWSLVFVILSVFSVFLMFCCSDVRFILFFLRMFSSYSQPKLNVKPVRSSEEIRRCKRWIVLDQMQHRVFPKVAFDCF